MKISDNVTRYSLVDDSIDSAVMEPDDYGDYVLYADFARVEAERDRLRALLKEIAATAREFSGHESYMETALDHIAAHAETALDNHAFSSKDP